jgi:hypothetical protein
MYNKNMDAPDMIWVYGYPDFTGQEDFKKCLIEQINSVIYDVDVVYDSVKEAYTKIFGIKQ